MGKLQQRRWRRYNRGIAPWYLREVGGARLADRGRRSPHPGVVGPSSFATRPRSADTQRARITPLRPVWLEGRPRGGTCIA